MISYWAAVGRPGGILCTAGECFGAAGRRWRLGTRRARVAPVWAAAKPEEWFAVLGMGGARDRNVGVAALTQHRMMVGAHRGKV